MTRGVLILWVHNEMDSSSRAPRDDARGLKFAIGEKRGGDETPRVERAGDAGAGEFYPHARPIVSDGFGVVPASRAPPREEHGGVHRGEGEDEMEETV